MKNASKGSASGLLLLGLCLGAAMVLSAYLVSTTLLRIKAANEKITVKGFAEKRVVSDVAVWTGDARIGGFDVSTDRLEAAEILGYLPENGPLYPEMTPETFLTYVGETRLMPRGQLAERLDYVVQHCGLAEVWGKAIGKLSRGYRQRVGMAQALLHDPDVLILDEPTSGLDPNQVQGVRELIQKLGETKAVLLSTHILQEVHAVCSRVIVISESRLVFDGPREDLGAEGTAMEQKFRKLTSVAV